MPKASKARRRPQNQHNPARQEQPATFESAPGTTQPRRRIQEMSPRTRVISLAVGDILCFLIFVSLGSNSHGKGINFFYSLWLSLPFVAAWFVVSPFVGAFRSDISTIPSKMLLRTMLAWLASWPVAMAFRWLIVERVAPVSLGSFISFSLVALLANLIILIVWRGPFALNNSLRKRGA